MVPPKALSFRSGSDSLNRKRMNLVWKNLAIFGIPIGCVSNLGNLRICRKLCALLRKQWAFRTPQILETHRNLSGCHGCRAPRTESEDLRRWWPHRWSHASKHHWRIEGNALWKEALWRSCWAQNPKNKCLGRRIVSRWWSDTGVCRAVACRIGSHCHLLHKRSWSRNKRGNLCRGPLPTQHPVVSHRDICWSLWKLQSGGQGVSPRVCDHH